MEFFIFKISTGEIIANRATSEPEKIEERYITAGLDWREGHAEDEYMLNGQKIARPTLPEPAASYDLTALPAGTIVTVADESGTVHEITDLSETLTLQGPQTYSVNVDPPFPYQRIVKKVEVA
jgi:hypothetical protein